MARPGIRSFALAFALPVLSGVALAKPPAKPTGATIPWLDDLEHGLAAAAKARRPVFLVTLWGPGT